MKLPPLIVIVGETASGKSALALELAQRFNGEIICADSWTVYKGFDIGTAKPSLADQQLIPHHLLDVAHAPDGFNAVMFQALAVAAIDAITARGNLPILIGGTGLYIDSVIYQYEFLAAPPVGMREELNKLSLDDLRNRAEKQGLSLHGIDTRNKRRVIRLIENDGKLPSRKPLRGNTLVLGVSMPREELQSRVEQRVEAMIAAGLEAEVRQMAAGYGWDVEPMKGIGYWQWKDYLQARHISGEDFRADAHVPERTLRSGTPPSSQTAREPEANTLSVAPTIEEVRARIIKGTTDLAKRQRTWFKRNESIQWLTTEDKLTDAVDLLTTFMHKHLN